MLVLGVGNCTRGDDGVGPCIAERVAALGLPGVEVVVEGEPLALLEIMSGHDDVVVVDAVAPQGGPGQVHVWDGASLPRGRATRAVGSHGMGVRDALELAAALDSLPGRLTVVGVEGESFDVGAPLSEAVRGSVGTAVQAVLEAVHRHLLDAGVHPDQMIAVKPRAPHVPGCAVALIEADIL